MIAFTIVRATELPADAFDAMVVESEREGWRFVRRLAEELAYGVNRFDRAGEVLLVARAAGAIVGVCGLNVDPYLNDPSTGRVRRLYVLPAYRGQGVGRQLVEAVVSAAQERFRSLRVRTSNPAAARLYEQLEFEPTIETPNCTHALNLICQATEDTTRSSTIQQN